MKILSIDTNYAEVLEQMGHKVLAPKLEPGVVSLPELMEKHDFKPDLLIQRERLGIRVILDGLAECPCTTVFISIDTHLNLYWQRYYACLFDLALTPHLDLFQKEAVMLDEPDWIASNVRRLRHAGYEREWRDYSVRRHALSFCGVVDGHRPLRKAMLELLSSRFPLCRPEGRMDFSKMMDMFADSRLVPNESISREVNFRLFEAASCGCLVLGQNVGEDQNVCFTPEREVVLYENSLDLLDKCGFYLKHPRLAEKVARNGWERVRAEHLLKHRAAELLELAAQSGSLPGGRAGGKDGIKTDGKANGGAGGISSGLAFLLTLLQLARHGSHRSNTAWLLKRLGAHAENPEGAAGILILLAEAGLPESPLYREQQAELYREQGLNFCRELLRSGLHADSIGCNLSASAFALLHGEPELALSFCKRQAAKIALDGTGAPVVSYADGEETGGSFADFSGAVHSCSAQANDDGARELFYNFYLDWAKVLLAAGRLAQPGFQLRIKRGFIPQTALECLFLAQAELVGGAEVNVENAALIEQLHRVCSRLPGYESLDMGFLAYQSLYDQQDWERQARYGLSGLRCLKLEEPLYELAEAGAKAAAIGQTDEFYRLLAEAPASEYIIRVVKELLG